MRARDLARKADSYFDKGRYNQALALYDEAAKQAPDDPDLYQSRGEVLARMGRYKEAIKSYDKAIKLNPNEWWYHLWKGDALLLLKQPVRALASYKKANSLNANSTAILYSMAISYVQLGRKKAACRALERVLQLKPGWRGKIARDRHFKPIRTEQEFKALLERRRGTAK